MNKFEFFKVGDVCIIAGRGAPGFADIGDEVRIIEILKDPGVRVKKISDGKVADFVYSCGMERLEFCRSVELQQPKPEDE